jgi:hypothetical protein
MATRVQAATTDAHAPSVLSGACDLMSALALGNHGLLVWRAYRDHEGALRFDDPVLVLLR